MGHRVVQYKFTESSEKHFEPITSVKLKPAIALLVVWVVQVVGLAYSSTLKLEIEYSSETLVNYYKATLHCILGDTILRNCHNKET